MKSYFTLCDGSREKSDIRLWSKFSEIADSSVKFIYSRTLISGTTFSGIFCLSGSFSRVFEFANKFASIKLEELKCKRVVPSPELESHKLVVFA